MILSPQGNKKNNFVQAQGSARKDIERAFGILQQRFAILRGPFRMFKVKKLTNIMMSCVILHNMIIEDERDDNEDPNIEYDQLDDEVPELSRLILQTSSSVIIILETTQHIISSKQI
ncbi:hypothetical protein F2P56_019333 [Juglans regia]|uniref:Protein ALP1-like n=1 Tax=Juglans regia TaxID=51240 RepID=A0A834CSK9_JUGRE|nr:hypothetical protein F2P56_019333 [Juglans regia]